MLCPLKEDNFGRMPECQPDCAWALKMVNGDMKEGFTSSYRCAVAVAARALNDMDEDSAFMTMPYIEGEVDDE